MTHSRRDLLRRSLYSAGGLTLASLATGLPASFLRTGRLAYAETVKKPTFLVLCTNSGGHPLNVNCPGSYPNPEDGNDPRRQIEHAMTAELGTEILEEAGGVGYGAADFEEGFPCMLGSALAYAARPWADLPEGIRAQMAVIRHQTYTSAHPEATNVLEMHGAVKGPGRIGGESLPSMLAQENYAALGTTLEAPMLVGGVGFVNKGLAVRKQRPDTLYSMFASSGTVFGMTPDEAADLRDYALDRIYREMKTRGTHAQKSVLDNYAISRDNARLLAEDLSVGLSPVSETNDPFEKQILTAVALIEYRVTPVITIDLPFGGDNHQDFDLYNEVTETIRGVHYIRRLYEELVAKGLDSETTFAYLSVFGRPLKRVGGGGRGHYGYDHATVMFGPNVTPGLYGQITEDLKAGDIGDIPANESLETAGKSIASAVGISEGVIEQRIVGGQPLF
ncbi:MAG: DUF1501 domain-containing protein [Myxococcota bacterium]